MHFIFLFFISLSMGACFLEGMHNACSLITTIKNDHPSLFVHYKLTVHYPHTSGKIPYINNCLIAPQVPQALPSIIKYYQPLSQVAQYLNGHIGQPCTLHIGLTPKTITYAIINNGMQHTFLKKEWPLPLLNQYFIDADHPFYFIISRHSHTEKIEENCPYAPQDRIKIEIITDLKDPSTFTLQKKE